MAELSPGKSFDALLTDDGRFAQLGELSRGKAFDVLLTANRLDHALLGAPGKHSQRFINPINQSVVAGE